MGQYSSREHSLGEYLPHPKGEGSGGSTRRGITRRGSTPTSKAERSQVT
jgi:hypothetical protein